MVPVYLQKGQRVDYLFQVDGAQPIWFSGSVRRTNRRAVWVALDFDEGDQQTVLLHQANEGTSWRYSREQHPAVDPADTTMLTGHGLLSKTELAAPLHYAGADHRGTKEALAPRLESLVKDRLEVAAALDSIVNAVVGQSCAIAEPVEGTSQRAAAAAEGATAAALSILGSQPAASHQLDMCSLEAETSLGTERTSSTRRTSTRLRARGLKRKAVSTPETSHSRPERNLASSSSVHSRAPASDTPSLPHDGASHAKTVEQELAMYDAETKMLEDSLRASFEQQQQVLQSTRARGRSVLLARCRRQPQPQSQRDHRQRVKAKTEPTSLYTNPRKRRKWTPGLTAAQQPRFQKSDFIGVLWDGQHWRAEVVDHRGKTRKAADTKPRLVGYFEEEVDAAKAVDKASTELMIERVDHGCGRSVGGAKRKLNFPSQTKNHENEDSARRIRTSLLRGVKFIANEGFGKREQWLAVIRGTDGKVRDIGRFRTEVEAGRAYDRAATDVHGIKAKLNFDALPSTEPAANPVRSPVKYSATMEGQGLQRKKSSKYRGVAWHHNPHSKLADSYWTVNIRINGKQKTVRFVDDDPIQGKRIRDEVEAAKFHDQLAIKHHGHNALLNFPEAHFEKMRALQIEARKRGDFGSGCGSSIFRGVSKHIKSQKPNWVANIGGHGHLGTFSDEISAARAYDQAALRVHGCNAKLNFPSEEIAQIAQRQLNAEQQTTQARKSVYRGVKWDVASRKWTVLVNGRMLEPPSCPGSGSVGLFSDEKSAAVAYDRAWLERHGDLHDKQQIEQLGTLLNDPEASWAWFRQQTNQRNGSKYLGVVWARHAKNGRGQWKATIQCASARRDCKTADGTTYRILGFFDDEESAARAYDKEALGLNPNVPDVDLNFAMDRDSVTSAEIERKRKYGDACKIGSRFRGVTWSTRDRKWYAQIARNKDKHTFLGNFDREEDAARAYDKEALHVHGARAILNFPEDHVVQRRKLQQNARENGVAAGKGGSSAYRGVSKRKRGNRWTATINPSGKKTLFLGSFSVEVVAAQAYDKAATAIFGANAILNFPEEHADDQQDDEDDYQPVRTRQTSLADDKSIEVNLGRRLDYMFTTEGVNKWYTGIVKSKTNYPGWYEVAFDDGECITALIKAEGQGTAWRWTSDYDVEPDTSAGDDCPRRTSNLPPDDIADGASSESDDDVYELRRENYLLSMPRTDSGAYGSECLATSVFVSVRER